jgi:hypothetical protein
VPVRPETALRLLTWLLSIMGGMMALAFVPVVMPTAWMAEIAEWLGVGPLPPTPLTEYLTRSLSAIYGGFGLLHLYLARHAGRYLDLVVVIGWLTVVLGVILTVLDFGIGMPPLWSWSEGPPTIVTGWAFVWLARRATSSSR